MARDDASEAVYRNHILAALPVSEIEQLRPHLSRMTMVLGQVLHEGNSPITDVFFIENGVVSLTADTHDQGRVEVGLLGTRRICRCVSDPQRGAVVGSSRIHSGCRRRISNECYCTTLCRRAIRKPSTPLSASHRDAGWSDLASGCLQCPPQFAERLARWLLMVRDRTDTDNVPMTSGIPVGDVGCPPIGRVSGSQHASNRRRRHRLLRGHVLILDHDGLTTDGCDCYRIIQENRDRISGPRISTWQRFGTTVYLVPDRRTSL